MAPIEANASEGEKPIENRDLMEKLVNGEASNSTQRFRDYQNIVA